MAVQYDGGFDLAAFPIGAGYGAIVGAGAGLIAGVGVALALSWFIANKDSTDYPVMRRRKTRLTSGAAAAVSVSLPWAVYLAQPDALKYADTAFVAVIAGTVLVSAVISAVRGRHYVDATP